MYVKRSITIVSIAKPRQQQMNTELQWLGQSLGLFHVRDKDKSCYRVFIELLKAAKTGEPISSDELAEKLGLSRGTVIHHINRLIEAGIVTFERKRYALREDSLHELVDDIKKDMEKTLTDLKKAAEELDKVLGL